MKNVKLSEFTPDPKNANKGTERGRGMLEKSLQDLGAGRSVLADKHGVLIAGNKTLQTAVEAGFEDAIVVESDGTRLVIVKRTDLDLSTDDKAKQLAIADNRIGQVSLEWDADVLAELSQEVDLSDFFFPDELANFLPTAEPPSPEEDEETTADLMEQAKAGAIQSRVKLNEVWACGRHRICCGDSTDEGNVRKLLGDRKVDLLFTSPPYADMRTYEDGTDVSLEKLCKFIPAWVDHVDYFAVNLGLKFEDCEVIPYWQQYIDTAKGCGLKLLAWNVWDKQQAGSVAHATNMFHLTHEWILVFGERRKALNRTIPNQLEKYKKRHGANVLLEGRDLTVRQKDGTMGDTTSAAYTHHQIHSVVQCFPELGAVRSLHPAIYPIALPTQYFEAMTGDTALLADPFLGSGTSIIAAQQMEGDRAVYGFELSPDYCEVALQRFSNFTGIVPELVGTL